MKTKNILILSLFVLSIFFFYSCEDEIVKSDYEKSDTGKMPTLTLSVSNISYDTAAATATYSLNGDTISEKGFIVSTDEDFYTIESIVVDETDGTEFSGSLSSLIGSTTYYAKSYAVSPNGIGLSDVVTFTTEEAPIFEDTYLFGTYIESDYVSGVLDYQNYVEFTEIDGSANTFTIYNLWDWGESIIASVDFDTKTITIDPQVIYVSSDYGDFYLYAVEVDESGSPTALLSQMTATYDENGNVTFDYPWIAYLISGDYSGSYYGPYTSTFAIYTEEKKLEIRKSPKSESLKTLDKKLVMKK